MKANFTADKVFEVQGNYGYLQCAQGCHDKLYDNESLVKEMVEKTADWTDYHPMLVPKCPVCGGEKRGPNLRIDQYFVQDENWYELNQSIISS